MSIDARALRKPSKAYIRSLTTILMFVTIASSAQDQPVDSETQHAKSHMSDSYVLVLKKKAIARGPDFSQRALAIRYGKKRHLRDFVWFRSQRDCFVAADPKSIEQIREF